jgi:transcriptional regulator CtsR
VGDSIDAWTTRAFLSNLLTAEAVDANTARLMAAAMGENALRCLPPEARDAVRASIFKQMLLNGVKE